jgi:hypothetical protein
VQWLSWVRSHLHSAFLSAHLARAIESKPEGPSGSDLEDLRAHATSGVIASAAFLEATINEFFAGAAETPGTLGGSGGRLKVLWEEWLARGRGPASTLDKYQLALGFLDAQPFDRGADPYQSAGDLVQLRNHLIHFVAEAFYGTTPVNRRLRDLRHRFPPSPAVPQSAIFPDEALGYPSARWAATTALQFADEFYGRIPLSPPYAQYRPAVIP